MEKVLVQLIAFNKTGNKPMHPLHVELSIQTTWFFRNAKYKQNAFFHEESILYELTENPMAQAVERLTPESIQKVIKQQALLGQEVDKSLIAKKKKERFPEEKIVDLHIHEIVEEEAGLKSGEMLELQMAKFEEELNACLKSPTKKIVFIHGVGNGKLKHELRKRLERKYPKLQFQDASFAEYGWGATLVYLQ
jgi:dsDNA-specific endonuclease/ATPase MutS2